VVIATREEHVCVPIHNGAKTSAGHVNSLHDAVALTMELAHLIPIDHVDQGILGGLQQQVSMRPRLVRQQQWPARSHIGIRIADLRLIVRCEAITNHVRRVVERKLEHRVAIIAATRSSLERAVSRGDEHIAAGIGQGWCNGASYAILSCTHAVVQQNVPLTQDHPYE